MSTPTSPPALATDCSLAVARTFDETPPHIAADVAELIICQVLEEARGAMVVPIAQMGDPHAGVGHEGYVRFLQRVTLDLGQLMKEEALLVMEAGPGTEPL